MSWKYMAIRYGIQDKKVKTRPIGLPIIVNVDIIAGALSSLLRLDFMI